MTVRGGVTWCATPGNRILRLNLEGIERKRVSSRLGRASERTLYVTVPENRFLRDSDLIDIWY